MKNIRPKQAKVHFAYFVQRLFCTTWNNRKTLNLTLSSILMRRFRCNCRRSFLNSLLSSWEVQANIPTLFQWSSLRTKSKFFAKEIRN